MIFLSRAILGPYKLKWTIYAFEGFFLTSLLSHHIQFYFEYDFWWVSLLFRKWWVQVSQFSVERSLCERRFGVGCEWLVSYSNPHHWKGIKRSATSATQLIQLNVCWAVNDAQKLHKLSSHRLTLRVKEKKCIPENRCNTHLRYFLYIFLILASPFFRMCLWQLGDS